MKPTQADRQKGASHQDQAAGETYLVICNRRTWTRTMAGAVQQSSAMDSGLLGLASEEAEITAFSLKEPFLIAFGGV